MLLGIKPVEYDMQCGFRDISKMNGVGIYT